MNQNKIKTFTKVHLDTGKIEYVSYPEIFEKNFINLYQLLLANSGTHCTFPRGTKIKIRALFTAHLLAIKIFGGKDAYCQYFCCKSQSDYIEVKKLISTSLPLLKFPEEIAAPCVLILRRENEVFKYVMENHDVG